MVGALFDSCFSLKTRFMKRSTVLQELYARFLSAFRSAPENFHHYNDVPYEAPVKKVVDIAMEAFNNYPVRSVANELTEVFFLETALDAFTDFLDAFQEAKRGPAIAAGEALSFGGYGQH